MKTPSAGQRHVAVPLRAGPAVLVEAGDTVEPETVAPLRLEDLRRIPSARFVARGRIDAEGAVADVEGYLAAARAGATLTWTVTAGDLGRVIAQLARSVGALHDEGRVHADVKPANAVVTTGGVFAIDPIGVVAGHASPGATPGWAAPEQLLSRPVLPATDVYPLGLMVARLLGAVVSGEERSFVVPLGRGQRHRVRLLSDHDVHIDPSLELPAPIRAAWEALIRQAVEFDPDDRTGSTSELADRIDELLEAGPLTDRVVLQPGPGRLERNVDLGTGVQPAWLVTDRRSPCS
jgi:serine/threonine protein kinase